MLVKVLDGCAFKGSGWVFAASATDLGFEVDVARRLGMCHRYGNVPGALAPAMTDVVAFRTPVGRRRPRSRHSAGPTGVP